jgi:serine/threonine protein kinase
VNIQWQQVKAALADAMALTDEARAAFLERLGSADPALRAEVESLLAAEELAGTGFMETPAPAAIGFDDAPVKFVGRRLGPYELLAQIGAGGMGEVYRAARVDREYRQEVAIKLVRAGPESSFIANRLRAERQILASFAHPNIARLLDGGTTEEGIPYLVMELIDGQPITQYCDGRRLDTASRLRLFVQVCAAVQYAHQRMVIHRDLKPSNILVTPDGVPKLLDFGIAKILRSDTVAVAIDLTVTAFGMLTPQYASPEQFTGEAVTAVSDVYSLGVILYEILTGSPPYLLPNTGNAPEVVLAVLTKEPKKPSSVVRPPTGPRARSESPERLSRRLRGDLDNIVLMALRKEPQRRYAGAEQFAEDIRRHLQHLPVIARTDTLGYRTASFIRRHTLGVVATGVALAALLAGIVVTTWEARVAGVQRESAEHRFGEIRKLANSLIFDVHDSIRDLPGSSKTRHVLIDTSLHYLNGLSREAPGDPGLERELAAAYDRLGDLQGRVFAANEGDYLGARASYQSSLALLQAALRQDPGNSNVRRDLVVSCGKLSDLLWLTGDAAGALEYSRLTVMHSAALADANGREPRFQGLLASAQLDYGYKLYHIRGDRVQALHYMQPAVEILAKLSAVDPNNQRFARTLALGYGRMAEVIASDESRSQDAWPLQLKQQRLLDQLIAAAPASDDLAHLHAFAQHEAAMTLLRMGRPDEALGFAQNALAAFRSLSASDTKIEEYHADIGFALDDVAGIALLRREPERAVALLQEAMTQTAELGAASAPQSRMARADTESLLSDAESALAVDTRRDSFQRGRDREDACQHLKEALAVYTATSGRFAEAAQQLRQQSGKLDRCRQLLNRGEPASARPLVP